MMPMFGIADCYETPYRHHARIRGRWYNITLRWQRHSTLTVIAYIVCHHGVGHQYADTIFCRVGNTPLVTPRCYHFGIKVVAAGHAAGHVVYVAGYHCRSYYDVVNAIALSLFVITPMPAVECYSGY